MSEHTTDQLVRKFAELKVWFAVNEVTHRTVEGDDKHVELCNVVDELRRRGVLSAS